MAIVAPVLSPPPPLLPDPEALRADGEEEAEVDELEEDGVNVGVSTEGTGRVLVMVTIDGGRVLPGSVGVWTITDVTAMTLVVEGIVEEVELGATIVVEGGIDVLKTEEVVMVLVDTDVVLPEVMVVVEKDVVKDTELEVVLALELSGQRSALLAITTCMRPRRTCIRHLENELVPQQRESVR